MFVLLSVELAEVFLFGFFLLEFSDLYGIIPERTFTAFLNL